MTTVPKPDTPPPANNANTTIVSDSMSGNYGRPASGGPPVAGKSEGNPPTGGAPSGSVPGYAINWSGNPPSTSGYPAGPDIGHGATQIVASPDETGHPASDASMGTVGDSGNQGAGPGSIPTVSGMPDIDNDGDAL